MHLGAKGDRGRQLVRHPDRMLHLWILSASCTTVFSASAAFTFPSGNVACVVGAPCLQKSEGNMQSRQPARYRRYWEVNRPVSLEPGKYVLFLGRFSPEKGCHLLVEAFEHIVTGVKLVITGASSYCDEDGPELRTDAGERLWMLDWVSGETLDELLTNAMVIVLPSDLEGLFLAPLDPGEPESAC